MVSKIRNEQEVFLELEKLCASPGYAHAIAYFCFRDNTIKYVDEMSVENVLQQFSMERLVRTEISTLIGLACKTNLDTDQPSPDALQKYVAETEDLLKELHKSMMLPIMQSFDPAKMLGADFNPFSSGYVLRESIFYSGEAAYGFQYRDLSKVKYDKDNDWFLENKGYSIKEADAVVSAIASCQNERINNLMLELAKKKPEEWMFLPAFIFTVNEISSKTEVNGSTIRALIESFVAPEEIDMGEFSALDDFNPKNAYPIIKLNDTDYLLFQNLSLVEALYETPFFWLNDDSSYRTTARENRGAFTEDFSEERLKLVFGENRVFTNIDIYKNKKTRVGEIDVLVIFSNRAIVLQAKSKKLTIAARKGNDSCLKDDFKKSVQDAYDQAFLCAEFLQNSDYKLIDSDGSELNIQRKYKEIYPFCIVSDHYPALSFQARQFLQYQETETIMPPFVMDVFLLDVMTEMLQSPLHFLSYINRRTCYGEKIISNHELTILSYHLKQNLWFENEYSMVQLCDDICADLDLAMLTRRDNVPGVDTPEGILTRYRDTAFGQIIRDIDKRDDSSTIDLGFMLLSLSEDTIEKINEGISKLVELSNKDGKHHDITLAFSEGGNGLTIHCNNDQFPAAGPRLEGHCTSRKYALKAKTWFGICIDPGNSRVKFGLSLDYDWEQSDEMDEATKDLPKPQHLNYKKAINFDTKVRSKRKIGRNEKCPCGSGNKYKKCCLP